MNRVMNWKEFPASLGIGKRVSAIVLVAGCVGLVFWSVTIRLALVT